MKYLLTVLLISQFAGAYAASGFLNTQQKDSIKYIDRTNTLTAGTSFIYSEYSIVFRNIFANLKGDLYSDHYDMDKNITHWRFQPSVTQNYISAFASTRYGTFSYSKSVPFNFAGESQWKSIHFSLPIMKWSITLDHQKFTGLDRIEPVYGTKEFMKDMTVKPTVITLEYSGEKGGKNIRKFSSLRNTYLNTPTGYNESISFVAGYSEMTIENNGMDFIPALQYADSTNNPEKIEMVPGSYLYKLTSKGGILGIKLSYILPITKRGNNDNFRILYLKAIANFIYNIQFYKFYSLTDDFDNPQFRENQKGNFPSTNILIHGSLNYDAGKFITGITGSYYELKYGKTGSGYDGNHAKDKRINGTVFFAYRFPFDGFIGKVEAFKSKF